MISPFRFYSKDLETFYKNARESKPVDFLKEYKTFMASLGSAEIGGFLGNVAFAKIAGALFGNPGISATASFVGENLGFMAPFFAINIKRQELYTAKQLWDFTKSFFKATIPPAAAYFAVRPLATYVLIKYYHVDEGIAAGSSQLICGLIYYPILAYAGRKSKLIRTEHEMDTKSGDI
ncbi:MAG: hypothetical protein ABIA21_03570 [Candidatus Aenigmatarchaeota archaeon]